MYVDGKPSLKEKVSKLLQDKQKCEKRRDWSDAGLERLHWGAMGQDWGKQNWTGLRVLLVAGSSDYRQSECLACDPSNTPQISFALQSKQSLGELTPKRFLETELRISKLHWGRHSLLQPKERQ